MNDRHLSADEQGPGSTEPKEAVERKTRRKSGKRDEILRAAVELFGSHGYDAVSLRGLMAEVGLKPPAFYNHFKSKEDLLTTAIKAGIDVFNTNVVALDDSTKDPVTRLDLLVNRHVMYQIENASFAKANDRLIDSAMLDRIGVPGLKQEIRALMRHYFEKSSEIIQIIFAQRNEQKLDPRICALAIGTMCDNVLSWYRPSGTDSPEKIARRMSEMVRNMLQISSAE